MEEDGFPETMSPVSMPAAADTACMSHDPHVQAESAAVKVNVKAGQKRKLQDSNSNLLPRSV